MAEVPDAVQAMRRQMDIALLMKALFIGGQPAPQRLQDLIKTSVLHADTVKLLTQVHLMLRWVGWDINWGVALPHIKRQPDPDRDGSPRIQLYVESKGDVLAQLRLCVEYLGCSRISYRPDFPATDESGGFLSFTIPLEYAQKLMGE